MFISDTNIDLPSLVASVDVSQRTRHSNEPVREKWLL